MTVALERTPSIVRNRITEAQETLQVLTLYVIAHRAALDLTQVQLLASKVSVALDAARYELTDAVCDAEAAIARC